MASPFTIDIPADRLATIMAKVTAYDWSQVPDAGGWTAGVGVDDLKRLVVYWRDSFDWRAVERRLNRRPQFTADIAGERIHFVHLRGDGSKPPLLLLHGWPGSYLEFDALLDPLVGRRSRRDRAVAAGLRLFQADHGRHRPAPGGGTLMHDLMAQLFGTASALWSKAVTGGTASPAGWPTTVPTP